MVNNTYRCPIMAFIDILEKIFHRRNRCSNLNVDMAVVFCREVWIVWHDMCICEYMTVFINCDAVVSSPIYRIPIYFRYCLLTKSFWKTLAALAILHA